MSAKKWKMLYEVSDIDNHVYNPFVGATTINICMILLGFDESKADHTTCICEGQRCSQAPRL